MSRARSVVTALSVPVALALAVGAAQPVDARPVAPSAAAAAGKPAQCAPAYHPRKTLFGLNLSGSQGFGKVPVVRNWDNSPAPRSLRDQTSRLQRKSALVISIRHSPQEVIAGQWDSEIRNFFRHAPRKRLVFWNYYHEPEEGVKSHQFTAAQFRRAFRHVAGIAARFCRSNLVPTLVLQGWTADPRSGPGSNGGWRSWRSFYPGRHYTSVVAWDPYNSATHRPSSYAAPSQLYHYAVRNSRRVGKPWAIAETGSALVSGDQGRHRARWLHKVARYSRKHDAAFVTYFSSVGRVNDFRLTDAPSRKAWRTEMHR